MLSRRGFLKTAGAICFASLSMGAYGFGIEAPARPRIVTHRVTPPGWPSGLTLRLVLVSDIHACQPFMTAARIADICRQANALGGDMILLLGDFLSDMRMTTPVPPAAWAAEIRQLTAPLGVHAILGNHDWFDDPLAMRSGGGRTIVHDALAAIGLPLYENRAVRLEKNGRGFWLAGLADQLGPRPGLDDLPGTLAHVTDDAPVILMAHEPDIFPTVPDRVSITLSGHLHGGQIRILGFAPIVPSRYGARYLHGHIVEGGRHLVVSGGLGTTLLPVRLGSPPELTVVELG